MNHFHAPSLYKHICLAAALALSTAAHAADNAQAASTQPVFSVPVPDGSTPPKFPWDLKALQSPPKMVPAEEFSQRAREDGLHAIFYDGLPYRGQPTRVFAWYGAPKDAKPGQKFPAMVLVHGGGGTAFTDWVKLWNSRGYAAIAMDNCGGVPARVDPADSKKGWRRHTMSGPNGWGGFDQITLPLDQQWTYHAVADVILAHSLIRSFPEVDADRIGLTGISWGGYLTCIVAGLDDRFKFAVPVYGCGFLGENSVWVPRFASMGRENAQRWLTMWDPSQYLPYAKMPMLWVTGTNDFAFPPDSLQKSYRLPGSDRTLCVRVRMPHGHGGPGENPAEILAFAQSIIGNGAPLVKITAQGRESSPAGPAAWVQYAASTPLAAAELAYTKDTGKWQNRKWETLPARIDIERNRVTANLPEGATVYYFILKGPDKTYQKSVASPTFAQADGVLLETTKDQRDLLVTSEHVELP